MKWAALLVLVASTACEKRDPASEATPLPSGKSAAPSASGAPSASSVPIPLSSADQDERSRLDGGPQIENVKALEIVNTKVEDQLTIAQGVYGQTTSQDDVVDYEGDTNPVRYFPMPVDVFAPGGKGEARASVRSDKRGFYEIPLAAGSYSLCTSFKRCTKFRVESGECVRLDYSFSMSVGWSRAKVIPCPARAE